MSTINTNGINVNYPVPGVNNNSQGFRDNFVAIKTDLNTAASEITDLQNKVVVKQALSGYNVNNDMANTIISNAVTKTFRASTYDLGSNLSGSIVIDTTKGDVQLIYEKGCSNTIIGSTAMIIDRLQEPLPQIIEVKANPLENEPN